MLCLLLASGACRRTVEVNAFPSNFVGVGVELRIDNDLPVVVRTITGGPSDLAGVKAGDRIVTIAGASTHGVSLGNVVMRLRGAPGTQVDVTIERHGTVRTVPVKRQAMQRDTVDYRPQK